MIYYVRVVCWLCLERSIIMSLRVERVEPVSSTKSATQKQYDPLRFWRSKIAQQKPRKQAHQEKSFRNILLTSSETSQTSQEEKNNY